MRLAALTTAILAIITGCASPYRCDFEMDPADYLGDTRHIVDLEDFDICAEATVPDRHEFVMEPGFTYSFRVIADQPLDIGDMAILRDVGYSCHPWLMEDAGHCLEVGYDCMADNSSDGNGSAERVSVRAVQATFTRVTFRTLNN